MLQNEIDEAELSSLKIINENIKELIQYPIKGIGLTLANNPYDFLVNIKLMTGIFEGYVFQLLIKFTINFPKEPPTILIFPEQNLAFYIKNISLIDTKFNDNIIYKFYKFEIESIWNENITFRILLFHIQIYLSDILNYNYSLSLFPSIYPLMKSRESLKTSFILTNGAIVENTWDNPYPKIYFNDNDEGLESIIYINKCLEKAIEIAKIRVLTKFVHIITIEYLINNEFGIKNIDIIKANLECNIYKYNYFDDSDNIFGYALWRYENKIQNVELISFEGLKDSKKYFTFDNTSFDIWIPIYISDSHFYRINRFYANSLHKKDIYINPKEIIEITPKLIYEMIVNIADEENLNSKTPSFIRCLFHYLLLFKMYTKKFKRIYKKYIKNI